MFSIPLVVACVWGGIEFNAASPTCGTCSRSEPNTVEADVVYHWTGSMEPKSLYVHSVISGISLHTQRRVFLNKTYLSHWGWGPATQKSSGRFMCEWKTPGTEEEEPSHPSLHANTRARFTDVSSPSSCAAKASNSFSQTDHVVPDHQEEHGRRFAAAAAWTSSQSLKDLLQRWCCMSAAHFSFCGGRAGYFRGDKRERGRGATQWHPDNSVRMSAPFSGPNLIFRPRSLIHTHYDNDWQDL